MFIDKPVSEEKPALSPKKVKRSHVTTRGLGFRSKKDKCHVTSTTPEKEVQDKSFDDVKVTETSKVKQDQRKSGIIYGRVTWKPPGE